MPHETDLIYPDSETLLPFQADVIEQMLAFLKNGPAASVYNACEMGLGKTPMALVAVNTLLSHVLQPRILVVCPAIVRLVWASEIARWCPWAKAVVISSGKDVTTMFQQPYHFLITSYDLAAAYPLSSYLESKIWDVLIMDESHYLKNSRAKRTRSVLQRIWPKATYRIALSGTPFTTRVVDGYTLFRRMLPGRWPDFDAFAAEFSYCQIKNIGSRVIKDYFGVKNPEVLRALIRSNFYVRKTKSEVLKELPDKIYNRVTLPIKYAVEPKSKSASDDLKIEAELIRRMIESGGSLPPIPASLAEHRRLQGEKKVEAVVDFVSDLLEQEIPTVIFAWHKNVISALEMAFAGNRPAVITGDTAQKDRAVAVDRFQSGETLLFIGNYAASGVGITLTRSSTVVCAELDWSPAVISQAVDRLHRIGQKDAVNIYYFVVENSLDEAISNTVMGRTRTFKSVLDEN